MAQATKSSFLGVGWSFPVKVDETGKTQMSYYEKSIAESVRIILGTMKGERLMRPDFGCEINDLVFAPNNSNTRSLIAFHVEEALVKWEPRIIVQKVEALPNDSDETQIDISVEYVVREINSFFNYVYPFYLERGESDTQSQFG